MNFEREIATLPLCQELFPLLELHYREIAVDQDIPLTPDFAKYTQLEALGRLRVYTARDDDRLLWGYAIYFVGPNMHYQTSLQAVQDVLFMHPGRRGVGGRLIRFADDELAKDGVQKVFHHVKLAHDFGPLLKRQGYEPIEAIYARRLDHRRKVEAE